VNLGEESFGGPFQNPGGNVMQSQVQGYWSLVILALTPAGDITKGGFLSHLWRFEEIQGNCFKTFTLITLIYQR
jgi:hypothetical protein